MSIQSRILKTLRTEKSLLKEKIRYKRHLNSLPQRIADMRSKDEIKVLFVLWDLSMWKTEALYKAMADHPRFQPMLGIVLNIEDSPSVSADKFVRLKEYVKHKEYSFIELTDKSMERFNADLFFYEKPYDYSIKDSLWYNCGNRLVCHSNYAFNSNNMRWCFNLPLHRYSAFYFLENESIKKLVKDTLNLDMHKFEVTGLPFMDDLLSPKETFENPWKEQTSYRKRIIWAPHYSMPVLGRPFTYSCFLDVCDTMLELADKYKDRVFFAFKPHPLLKSKLIDLWGEEKTENYFRQWETKENAQVELGAYMGLFKYSDAMIHDCSSFTIEYMYARKPVMYLVNGEPHTELLNDFGQGSYQCHYMGHSRQEIEQFILNVIHGVDPMKDQRDKFFAENLLPPNGKTACENIIDALLGLNGYK